MANYNAVSLKTGAVEVAKLMVPGETNVLYTITTPTTMSLNDTITGPTLPRNTTLLDMTVTAGAITGLAFTAGYAGTAAAIITGGALNTVSRLNVVGALGYTSTTDTPILLTLTGGTTASGVIRILVTYSSNA
jgi:hypothetical protein